MNAQTSKKGTFIIPLIIGVLIAGALAWYFWPKLQQKSTEVPPSITISSSKFQGLISGGDVCKIPGIYAFTDAQVSSYIKPGADNAANWNTLEQGVHIYHAGVDMTVQEIMNAIVPTTGNKIMIAYYPADTENAEKKFVTYPGIAGQTEIGKPEAYSIPANQGFEIFSCQDTKIWKIRTEKMGADAVTPILNTKDAGWILMPAVVDEGVVDDGFLAVHKNKIKSAWFQKGPGFDFQKVENMDNAQLIGDWKMIWLKIGPVEQQADPAANGNVVIDETGISKTINITTNKGLNKQVVIEWTDSAQGNAIDGYAIFRSITPNMDIKFPESYEAVNAKNPGNLAGWVGVNQLKKITDEILLQDDTTYYYVIKSIKVEKDESKVKILGTSVEFSVKTLPAAAANDPAAIPQTITITEKKGGNKQVTIEWTDSAQGNVIDGYAIFRSITPNMDIKFPESYKAVDFNPPGNFAGSVKVGLPETFTDKLSLQDNTIYYYVIKSVKWEEDEFKVIGTSKEFSVTTAFPPLQ